MINICRLGPAHVSLHLYVSVYLHISPYICVCTYYGLLSVVPRLNLLLPPSPPSLCFYAGEVVLNQVDPS